MKESETGWGLRQTARFIITWTLYCGEETAFMKDMLPSLLLPLRPTVVVNEVPPRTYHNGYQEYTFGSDTHRKTHNAYYHDGQCHSPVVVVVAVH